jgi:hypothetical protein
VLVAQVALTMEVTLFFQPLPVPGEGLVETLANQRALGEVVGALPM